MSFSQPEIENLGVSALGHEQVCRLDVAVNNSLRMRCIEGIGDFYSQLQQRFQLYRLCSNAMFQGYTIEKLHRDEGLSILVADIIDRANIRVVQGRCSLGLTLKARQGLGISGDFFGEEF